MEERREGTSRLGSCCCRQAGCAGVAGSERGSAKTGRDDAVIASHSVVEPGKAMKLHPPLPPLGAIVPPGPPSLCPGTKSIHNELFSRYFLIFYISFVFSFWNRKRKKENNKTKYRRGAYVRERLKRQRSHFGAFGSTSDAASTRRAVGGGAGELLCCRAAGRRVKAAALQECGGRTAFILHYYFCPTTGQQIISVAVVMRWAANQYTWRTQYGPADGRGQAAIFISARE